MSQTAALPAETQSCSLFEDDTVYEIVAPSVVREDLTAGLGDTMRKMARTHAFQMASDHLMRSARKVSR